MGGAKGDQLRVLLVDPFEQSRDALVAPLAAAGFAVDAVAAVDEARGYTETYPYAVILPRDDLNANLDALRMVSDWREQGEGTAFLVLACDLKLARMLALFEAGADDVVPRTADPAEIVARTRAVARRARGGTPHVTSRGSLQINWNTRDVRLEGRQIRLTAKEFGILELLATHPGRLFDRDEIIARVWNASFLAENNVVDVYVWNLRKKLGGKTIETIRGAGYRFPIE